jgi:PPOX class probable F420-dependent enzyme
MRMTQEQIEGILQRRLHAVVASNRPGKSPLLSPVWYLYQNGMVYITIAKDSARYRLLERDPHVSVCVESGFPDESYVTFYGTAEIIEKRTEEHQDIAWRGYRRYFDSDEEAQEAAAELGDWTANSAMVVITPEHTVGVNVNRDVWMDEDQERAGRT